MRLPVASAVGVGLVLSVLGVAAPATAAGDIGISDDGVTYGAAYPGTLFDSIAHLVPMDSQSEQFFVRNETSEPAFLRIVLRDVTYSDAAYGAALSVSASTPAESGPQTPLTTANPCIVLVEGQTVQPGEVVPISTVLSLGDLNGSAGQNASAALTLRIELHETTTGSLPATTCTSPPTTNPPTPGTDVIVVPKPRPGQGGASPVVPDTGAGEETPDGGTIGELPGENQSNIEPNTWLLYEERWWFLFLVAFATGSLCFMIVDWVRRKRGLEDETETGA